VEPIASQNQPPLIYPAPKTETPVEKANLDNEDSIRNSVARVNADMRSMATALESYFIDWNKYPTNLNSLTTPIAYLTQVFGDPFAKGNETLKLGVSEKNYWKTYSVGPDQEDDEAEIIYDPTNGTISEGDIVREKM